MLPLEYKPLEGIITTYVGKVFLKRPQQKKKKKKNMTWRCVAMDAKQGWEIATINILGMDGDEIKVVMEFENYLPSTTIFMEVYNT